MDLASANLDEMFWRKKLTGSLTSKREKFKHLFPDLFKSASDGEYGKDPPLLFSFLLDFGIVTNKKHLDCFKDVVDGKETKIKKFLRLNKSKKNIRSLRLSVILSCSFQHPGILDHLVKCLDRDCLAKFEHIPPFSLVF